MGEGDIEKDSRQGEKAFARLCNRLGCEYLFIDQGISTFSDEMQRQSEKRPDFLINVPNVAPLLIDVKTSKKYIRKNVPTFGINYGQFCRISKFEKRVKLSTWYAYIVNEDGGIKDEVAYAIPLSRIEKHIPDGISMKDGFYVPLSCMNRWSGEVYLDDICKKCKKEYCLR